jgi:hypothetical protein
VSVDDVRPAPQKCLRYELSLNPEPVASGATQPEGPNVNRQPITAQHGLPREIRIERDEGDVVTARDQGSDLGKWRGGTLPGRNLGGLVE